MGYLSAESGYDGDTSSCQISLSANPGNSGGPVFNKNGEIVGVLSAKQTQAEGVVFAIKAKGLYKMVDDLKQSDTSLQKMKMPSSTSLKGLNRIDQIKELQNYVFIIKAYNQK
jgi:S1-C subfamily serine protease